jgi:putative cell wall-binding protein
MLWGARIGYQRGDEGMSTRRARRSGGLARPFIAALLVAAAALSQPPPAQAAGASISRLWGSDRYATAAAISRAVFAPGVSAAYIATGANFPDSLAAGPAASLRRAPILLSSPGGLPEATRVELARLRPATIVILGGTGVVSSDVEAQLRGYTGGGVSRLAGPDRFATAAAISSAHFGPGAPVAYIASGRGFPDALSAGAAAAALGGPVLLVEQAIIPSAIQAELARLRPARIVVAGGVAVVSDAVLTALRAYTSGSVTRQWGPDRYATAAAISAAAFPSAASVHLATGLNFADAVAGVPAAALGGGPLLLASTGALPQATYAELERLDASEVTLLGGTAALSDAIIPAIRLATADATPLVRVGPHAFHTDGYAIQPVPAEWLAFNSSSLLAIYGTRDATGALLYPHTDGNWYDHPVGQAQYVVNMLRNYRLQPDQVYLDLALANGNRLLERAVHHQGAIFFPYPFDFALHGRGTMAAPWYSGMAQGIALSGFVRLWEVTADPKWLQAAHETFASFLVAREPGKPWVTAVENGLLWFELYPWFPYDHTYNGHIFATYGLYDYWRLTGSGEAYQLALGGITTAARVADIVRVPGGVSNYCIAQSCLDRMVRNTNYHLTVIGQFIQLYRYTRAESFARLADTFTADFPNFRTDGIVTFQPGTHVAYQFDSSGTGTPASSLTLPLSSATYVQRTVPYGWIRPGNGVWFYMDAGPFAGQWIRESSAAYASGFVDRLEYDWPRPLAVGAGDHTGYQFDADGTIIGLLTVPTQATTWEYTAGAKINGVPAVRISSGSLAGYWIAINGSGSETPTAAAVAMRSADLALTPPLSSLESPDSTTFTPPTQPADALIPPPLPGQQENGPVDGP